MRWIRQSLNWLAIKIIKRFFINYIPAHPLPIFPPPLPSKCGTNTCKRPSFSFFFFFPVNVLDTVFSSFFSVLFFLMILKVHLKSYHLPAALRLSLLFY